MPTLIQALTGSLRRYGRMPLYYEGDRSINRLETLVFAAAIAQRLAAEDLGPKPHVGILLPNGLGCAGAIWGALLGGNVAAPMNPLSPPEELAAQCANAHIRVILAGGPLLEKVKKIPGVVGVDVAAIKPSKKHLVPLAKYLLLDRFRSGDRPAIMIFTSGTTGLPKAAVLSHHNFIANVDSVAQVLHLEQGEFLLGVLPFFHSYGLTAGLFFCALKGLKLDMHMRFIPGPVLKSILEKKVAYIALVPSMYGLLLRQIRHEGAQLDFIRECISGGAPLPRGLAAAWKEGVGVEILEGYGQTEAAPVISNNRQDAIRRGTVGHVVPGGEVQIWDEDGKPLPHGEVGEIVYRGANVFLGYYNNPEETAKALTKDRWLKTGDFGEMGADGYLTITGRKKELIIVAGENVYPPEVENAISEVSGVIEVAVVAGFDETRGEFVRACVVPFKGNAEQGVPPADHEELEKAILERCRARLAPYKVPRRVEFYDELPRNTVGKILKRELEQRKDSPARAAEGAGRGAGAVTG